MLKEVKIAGDVPVRGAAAVNHPNYVSRLDGSVPPPPAGYAGDMRNGYGGGYSPYGSYGGWGAGPNYGGLSGSSSTITGGNYGGGPYGAQWGSGGSPPYGNTYGGPSYMRPPPPPPAAAPGGGNYGAPYGRYPPIQARPYPHPNLNSIDPCKSSSMGSFRKLGFKTRMRNFYVRRVLRADRIEECEKACVNEVDFICRAFNFKQAYPDNCELSDQDTRMLQLGNPTYFDQDSQYDYFERETFNPGGANRDCLDVSQTCSPDGMEFSVKTPDGFFGRIYTYGFYDSCFYDGNGGTLNVLRISRANGFPRCGTQQYGDVMTNIVVVQYNDYVQTSRDKKYNLTCYMSGPGETVVTSSYLDTRTDGRVPTQIEHLPAQNMLTSSVVLRVLYRGTPTNTIAVGDLLTFRLEARNSYQFEFFSDIFATNVIAKDPYSGRQVHLIDAKGCPVDLYVFPELHRAPDGALEAEFYAFKIPDSNLLVFSATVRTCRGPCEPAICTGRDRPGSFPSWGRRRRRRRAGDPAEDVHQLMEVFLNREDMPEQESLIGEAISTDVGTVCVPQASYQALVALVGLLMAALLAGGLGAAVLWQRLRRRQAKSERPVVGNLYVSPCAARGSEDPSEPIYTDPSLFEQPHAHKL